MAQLLRSILQEAAYMPKTIKQTARNLEICLELPVIPGMVQTPNRQIREDNED